MAEPPPRDPRDPADDETVVVPPSEPVPVPVDETIVRDEWGPETVVDQPVVEEGVVVEETETEARRQPPTIWPWLLGFLLLVLAGLGAYFYFAQQDESTVPAVTGLEQPRAEAEVRDAGLEPESTRQESEKPAGIVLAQSPQAGTEVEEGSNVRLVVSAGREPVAVPDVVGTTSSEATATLLEVGLKVNVVAVPSDQPSGSVVAQNPAAGEQADVGSTVRLNVAREPDGTTTQPPATTTVPAATTPPPATTTEPPTPEPATVPDVVGQELADAAGAFGEEGLKVGVRYVPSTEPQGRVVAQAQPAGTERERGDTVQVNVSTGAEPAAAAMVPSVSGRQLDEGREALEQAGFEVLALNLNGQVRNESPVASQSPAGGANIPSGSLVVLYVS